MSKIFPEGNSSITRDLKIDENAKNAYTDSEPLKSVTQKFLKEPLTLETFDKLFHQMGDTKGKKDNVTEDAPKKKSKRQEGKAIFNDIFIKPKEKKIKEIIDKRNQKNKSSVTTAQTYGKIYISNKINSEGKVLGMNSQAPQQIQYDFTSFVTNKAKKEEKKIEDGDDKEKKKKPKPKKTEFKNKEILEKTMKNHLKTERQGDVKLLNNFLHEKYIIHKHSTDTTKKNYFNQLIQIRPPEGINAVVASPLMDSKGWAPSIPSVNIDKLNTNLKDLMIRAKGGIKENDIIKEAHMAFYLGIMNEEEKKYENALKFYKKYFLSAKLLQDIYGTELALNRIAVLFSNIFDFEQSIYYNEKHKEITTHNLNKFVAHYNCGVCYRVLEDFEKSQKNFKEALEMSQEENDLESFTLCLAQMAITSIFVGDVDGYVEYSEEFFNKNKTLGHVEMELEMQILSGYIYNYIGNLDLSKALYENSLINSINCENERYKHVSLCNMGIIEADKDIDIFLTTLGDPEESKKLEFNRYNPEEDEEEEEEGNGVGGEGGEEQVNEGQEGNGNINGEGEGEEMGPEEEEKEGDEEAHQEEMGGEGDEQEMDGELDEHVGYEEEEEKEDGEGDADGEDDQEMDQGDADDIEGPQEGDDDM